jgi:hypothetical protein
MKKAILFLLLVVFGVSVANAGIVRLGVKTVKGTAKVASHPVRHPVKDAKHVGHAVRVVLW